MGKLEQKMIFQYGMNRKGFTLLEVVIATLILAVSLSVILKIYTNYIRNYGSLAKDIKAIQKVKRYIYDIKEEFKEIPAVKEKYEDTQYGVKKKIYIYNGSPVIFYYETR